MSERARTLLTVAAVAGLMAALMVPTTLARWWLTEDAIEHLLIAHEWVHGAGFVNPVQWHFFLDENPPLPGAATRAPLVSLLAALPLALGARVSTLIALHGLWSALVVGLVVLVSRRFMRPRAALATGLLLGLSPGWLFLARFPWTEVTAVAAFLAVLVSAPGVVRSVPRALLAAGITWLAWLTRPNLGALALAVLVAGAWDLGPRRAARHAGLWAYALGFVGMCLLTRAWIVSITSLPPFAAYGAAAEMFDARELFHYRKEFVGAFQFVSEHAEQVGARIALRCVQLFELLFLSPAFSFVGWLIPLGLLHAVRARRGALEIRVIAFALLGFSTLVVLYYAGFDRSRHAIFPVLTACLCGMAAVDAFSERLEQRLSIGRARALRGLPLVVITLLFVLGPGGGALPLALQSAAQYARQGTHERVGLRFEEVAAEFCRSMDADARVASFSPWGVALWCGNAAVVLPVDLDDVSIQGRFLDEKLPAYVVANADPDYAWVARSPRLQRVLVRGGYSLWRVLDPKPDPNPWTPAPPLACAGKPPGCARRVGR